MVKVSQSVSNNANFYTSNTHKLCYNALWYSVSSINPDNCMGLWLIFIKMIAMYFSLLNT